MASINRAAVIWTIGIVASATGIAAPGDDLAGSPVRPDAAQAPAISDDPATAGSRR